MENRKLLIAGIDPGITTGLAVLDIDGKLIHMNSSKHLDLNSLISDTIDYGKVILVGTDKSKVPGLVKAFATKLGARIISPNEDLKVSEKKQMTADFKINDDHQGDALASALFAYKTAKPLLEKIDSFAEESKKNNIKALIKELVILNKISIKSAASMIENKDEDSKIIEKAVSEKKFGENDFLRLYNKLKALEAEIKIIKSYNNNLKNKIAEIEHKKDPKEMHVHDSKKLFDFREKRIKFLENNIKSKARDAEHLKLLIRKMNGIFSDINSFFILKKIDNFGINELNFKNKILNIKKNDILLVDDPNIISSEAIELLKNTVFVIVHKKPVSKKIGDSLPFVFMHAKSLSIEEDRYFGFVKKTQFEAEKGRINWASKIIEDYKKEKQHLVFRQV